jgi:hypothetical protein
MSYVERGASFVHSSVRLQYLLYFVHLGDVHAEFLHYLHHMHMSVHARNVGRREAFVFTQYAHARAELAERSDDCNMAELTCYVCGCPPVIVNGIHVCAERAEDADGVFVTSTRSEVNCSESVTPAAHVQAHAVKVKEVNNLREPHSCSGEDVLVITIRLVDNVQSVLRNLLRKGDRQSEPHVKRYAQNTPELEFLNNSAAVLMASIHLQNV